MTGEKLSTNSTQTCRFKKKTKKPRNNVLKNTTSIHSERKNGLCKSGKKIPHFCGEGEGEEHSKVQR